MLFFPTFHITSGKGNAVGPLAEVNIENIKYEEGF